MANNQYINKVVYGNQTLIDLTSDTATADKILRGYTAHDASGEPIVGTYEGGAEGYTINLTASSSELYGQSIVVSYEGQRVTTIQFSNAGTASIVVQEEGAYNFAVSYGGLTYYCDVNVVSAIVTYNETIYYYPNGSTVTPVNDVQIWISCADVRDKNYTTLAEVFADIELLATLMASENAVNYLVRSKQFIGNKALVPIMTSNTTPSGEAFGISIKQDESDYSSITLNGDSNAYYCFDGNTNTYPLSRAGYDFGHPVVIDKVINVLNASVAVTCTVWGSNDKLANYTKVATYSTSGTALAVETHQFVNTSAYRYWFVVPIGQGSFREIQFYSTDGICQSSDAMSYIGANDYCTNTLLADSDWCEAICNSDYKENVLNFKNPIMTSNTTPEGEAFLSKKYSDSFGAWKAFDYDSSTSAIVLANPNNANGISYIGYISPIPYVLKMAKILNYGAEFVSGLRTIYVQGSDDGVTWDNLASYTFTQIAGVWENVFLTSNVAQYSQYRIYGEPLNYGTGNYHFSFKEIQFYGRSNGGVQTWLRKAGITNKTYTTLSEVFADSATLSALMANHDAVDYLVTCKGWATEVCSNQSAMSYIGLNNYCANTLLADITWNEAICNSAYFESVLNVKVPTMTSYTTPNGVVSASSENSAGRPAWWAFDDTMDYNWVSQSNLTTNQWIRYKFTTELSINKVEIYSTNRVKNFIVQCSNDNFVNDSHDVYSGICVNNTVVAKNTFNFVGTSGRYMYWQVLVQDIYADAVYPNISIEELQFYGRKDV